MTQEQFAAKLNVSRQSISSWENGRNLPDLEMTVEIAKVFGLSLDQLILGGSNMADKLIRDGSETRRAKINRSIVIIGTVLLCIGAACLLLKEQPWSISAAMDSCMRISFCFQSVSCSCLAV